MSVIWDPHIEHKSFIIETPKLPKHENKIPTRNYVP